MGCNRPNGCVCVQPQQQRCGWNTSARWEPVVPLADKPNRAASPPITEQKLDGGKPMMLRGVLEYFPRALRAVAGVSEYGSQKYKGWGGWRRVQDGIVRYGEAGLRHNVSDASGETHDPETKLLHKAHAAWNALAALEMVLAEAERQDAADAELRTQTTTPLAGFDVVTDTSGRS